MSLTQLIQNGNVVTEGPELVEAMLKQSKNMDKKVPGALGEAKEEYLAAGMK